MYNFWSVAVMISPGPRNLITDVDGITVGNAHDESARSGVTVILPENGATASGEVRGAAPGTRETDLLDPTCMIESIDAICLSGGSVHGLASGEAVVSWMYDEDRGFSLGAWRLPIVPAAIINDLGMGGTKEWGDSPDYSALARAACENAGLDFTLGNVGAGVGASAGRLKAGLGSASVVNEDGLQVAALVVTNPFGAAVMPGTGALWSWAMEQGGEMGGQHPPCATPDLEVELSLEGRSGENTTLAVVATNAVLNKAQLKRMAMMAHDGMARGIRPIHTPFDGDVVFALSTKQHTAGDLGFFSHVQISDIHTVAQIGALAADCLTRAIGRSVFEAEPLGDYPSYRQSHPDAFADDVDLG